MVDEDETEVAATISNSGMIVGDDGAANNIGKLCVFHLTYQSHLGTVKQFKKGLWCRTVGPRPGHNK